MILLRLSNVDADDCVVGHCFPRGGPYVVVAFFGFTFFVVLDSVL